MVPSPRTSTSAPATDPAGCVVAPGSGRRLATNATVSTFTGADDSQAAEHCVRTHLEQTFVELRAYLTAVDPADRIHVD